MLDAPAPPRSAPPSSTPSPPLLIAAARVIAEPPPPAPETATIVAPPRPITDEVPAEALTSSREPVAESAKTSAPDASLAPSSPPAEDPAAGHNTSASDPSPPISKPSPDSPATTDEPVPSSEKDSLEVGQVAQEEKAPPPPAEVAPTSAPVPVAKAETQPAKSEAPIPATPPSADTPKDKGDLLAFLSSSGRESPKGAQPRPRERLKLALSVFGLVTAVTASVIVAYPNEAQQVSDRLTAWAAQQIYPTREIALPAVAEPPPSKPATQSTTQDLSLAAARVPNPDAEAAFQAYAPDLLEPAIAVVEDAPASPVAPTPTSSAPQATASTPAPSPQPTPAPATVQAPAPSNAPAREAALPDRRDVVLAALPSVPAIPATPQPPRPSEPAATALQIMQAERAELIRAVAHLQGRLAVREEDYDRLKAENDRLRSDLAVALQRAGLATTPSVGETTLASVASGAPTLPPLAAPPPALTRNTGRDTAMPSTGCSNSVRRRCVVTVNQVAAERGILLDDIVAWSGVSMQDLIADNPGKFGRPLQTGETIRIR